jgi:hypothetical protein
MHTITLTRENIVNDENNRMVYDIPGSKNLEGSQIALSNLYMYYSWQNINANPLNNNKVQVQWPQLNEDNAGNPITQPSTLITITIPDGLYEVADLNAYVQQFCIDNNLYLINNTTGEYVYFIQAQVNITRYKLQFNSFALPQDATGIGPAPAAYAEPPGGFCNTPLLSGVGALGGFPGVVGDAPGWKFPANFSDWAGFSANYQQPAASPFYFQGLAAFPTGNTSFISTQTPNVQPNSVIFLNCNLISNLYTNPQTFMYPVPAKTGIGGLIQIDVPEYSWNQMIPGQAAQIILTFTDRNGQPILIQDPAIIVTLIIRDHDSKQLRMSASGPLGVPKSMETLRYSHNPQHNESSGQHSNISRRLHHSTNP